MDEWEYAQTTERSYYRMRNHVSFGSLKLGYDDDPMQGHQVELYQGELHPRINSWQMHGITSMALPGASVFAIFQGGQRSIGTIVATEDTRYRPKGLKPGEIHGYMIDEAKKDGSDGKTRSLFKGLLGWVHDIFGKVIHIGTNADTQTIEITSNTTIRIKAPTIILDGMVKLGGEDANIPVSMQGTVDSHGDTDVSGFATNVRVK